MEERNLTPSNFCCEQKQPAKFSPQKPTNENTITINMPSPQTPHNLEKTSQTIIVDPQPLKLNIDTSTDWPTIMVGFGSILSSLLVAYLTYINQKNQVETQKIQIEAQRNQVKSATANFRANWQISLRESIAKFLSTVAEISYEIEINQDYLDTPESNKLFSILVEKQAVIKLMLDPNKDYSTVIKDLMENLVDAARRKDLDSMNGLIKKLIEQSAKLLEKTWQDIQKDLSK